MSRNESDLQFSTTTIGLSIEQITTLFKNKKITATENVKQRFELIKKINPQINAVVQFSEEYALEQARLLDEKQASGKELGPLHGVIFTVKDVFKAKGFRTTAGSMGLKDAPMDTEDATFIKRLKDSGAILIGKTNTPEFENSADTINSVYGATKNPYNLYRSAGGSSGGSGAAVAACLSDFDIGADHGGSLRIPAHCNGVTTIRCTTGHIPSTGYFSGVREGIGASVNTEGPIARHVNDLVIIVNVIQGPDGIDSNVKKVSTPLIEISSLEELNIAYFDDDGNSKVTEEVKMAVKNAAKALADSGAFIKECKPSQIGKGFEIYKKVFWPLAAEGFNKLFKIYNVREPSYLIQKLIGNFKNYQLQGNPETELLKDFSTRLLEQEIFKKEIRDFFKKYDAFICPVIARDALPLTTPMWEGKIELLSFCWDTSAANLPAVVVRAGTSKEGLPIGVQIVTKPENEGIALAIAKKIEKKLGGWKMPELVLAYNNQTLAADDSRHETMTTFSLK